VTTPTQTLLRGKTADLRKVTLAASLGSIAEFFDWGVAASVSALVWPSIFFPQLTPTGAIAASLATFGVVYLVRPVGAFIFGRFGDRRGRRAGLMWTLVLMGAGSLGLGLAPGYAAIGLAAPLLLISLRVLQGLGHGGEWGGATTWVSELAADSKRRAFWTGWVTFAAPAGNLLAALSFFLLSSTMSKGAFTSYGWRLLFVTGAAVAVAGLLIRWRFVESPLFEAQSQNPQTEVANESFIKTEWRKITTLTLSFVCLTVVVGILTSTYGLNYLTKLGASSSTAVFYAWLARVPGLVAFVGGAVLADIKGRLLPLRVGVILLIPSVLLYFPLVNSNTFTAILLAFILIEVPVDFASGSIGALFTESFPTRIRNRGAGLSYHSGALINGLILTLLLPTIISYYGGVLNAATPVMITLLAVVVVSLLASLRVRETKSVGLTDGDIGSAVGVPSATKRQLPAPDECTGVR
jgi:MFS family permease